MSQGSTKPPYPWKRNPIFRFFASLNLALTLLGVLILGCAIGTLYESSFDAKTAKFYVYKAPWFFVWLIVLCLNLAAVAFSRWPWKKKHLPFLLAHLGIITLLVGGMIDIVWGLEGTMTLFKGEPAQRELVVDELQLTVNDPAHAAQFRAPLEFIHRKPTSDRPRHVLVTDGGWRIDTVDFAPHMQVRSRAIPADSDRQGVAALLVRCTSARMGQTIEEWITPDDPRRASLDLMGLARIDVQRGALPVAPTNLAETAFLFENRPGQGVSQILEGGAVGFQAQLTRSGSNTLVFVTLPGRDPVSMDVEALRTAPAPIPNSPFAVQLEGYWPDFVMKDGKPASQSDEPRNPAAQITLRGRGVPFQPPDPANASETAPGAAPSFEEIRGASGTSPNQLTFFLAPSGTFDFKLASRRAGTAFGSLGSGQALVSGWADWRIEVASYLPSADIVQEFVPMPHAPAKREEARPGVKIRVGKDGESHEDWVPLGWRVTFPAGSDSLQLTYGYRTYTLPFTVELMKFEVERYQGIGDPSSFRSTLRFQGDNGESSVGQAYMNHPANFPATWWGVFTGLTYKVSQTGWNPENPNQSSVQILRDPGWFFKWSGSLILVVGIYALFYMRPPAPDLRPTAPAPPRAQSKPGTKSHRRKAEATLP